MKVGSSIAKGIYEQQLPSYTLREDAEENKLFELNDSVRKLLAGLESNEKPKE